MTTATRPSPPMDQLSQFNVSFFQAGISEYKVTTSENGNPQIEGMKIFRSGTFRDSMGDQHTWEPEHITQMVSNFDSLRARGLLPNVPVREGHRSLFGGGGQVKGYVTSLSTSQGKDLEGNDTTFLNANYEFTEPDGFEKLTRGTYRARSAEVGMYSSNSEALYYPVLMGFAFVDIPAVEGLYESDKTQSFTLVYEETPVTQPTPPAPPAPPVVPTTSTEHNNSVVTTTPPAPAPAPIEFTINGQKVTDFAKVQAHIETLEGFKDSAIEAGRKAFAKELADSNKILASDLPEVEKRVLAMNEESFEVYKTTMAYSLAHPSNVGQSVSSGVTNSDGQSGNHGINELDDKIEIAEGIVKSLHSTGMKDEDIQRTSAYAKLQELRAQKTATA